MVICTCTLCVVPPSQQCWFMLPNCIWNLGAQMIVWSVLMVLERSRIPNSGKFHSVIFKGTHCLFSSAFLGSFLALWNCSRAAHHCTRGFESVTVNLWHLCTMKFTAWLQDLLSFFSTQAIFLLPQKNDQANEKTYGFQFYKKLNQQKFMSILEFGKIQNKK